MHPLLPMPRPALRACQRLLAGVLLAGAASGVTAQAQHSAQSPQLVAEVVTDYLLSRLEHLPGNPQIEVNAANVARHPACDFPEAFLAPGTRMRSRMSVGVRCLAPAWTAYVPAALSVPGEEWVAARTLEAGQVITAADLTPRPADLLSLAPATVLHPEQAIGSVVTRRVAAGRPLRTDALRSANAVQRGQAVRLLVRGAGFTVSGEGQALADAAPGASVQVRTGSGQVVTGIVRDATTVEIPL